jgi:hypothetical protein
MLTAFGAAAVTFMMCMYALERRHRGYIFAFACACALSSTEREQALPLKKPRRAGLFE